MAPTASSLQGIDPSAPGTIIRYALAFESIFTVCIGVYDLFFPRRFLLSSMGATAAQATTTAVQCTQQLGASTMLIGAAIGVLVSNTRTSIEARPVLYRVLLGFELFYTPLLLWQGFTMEGGMANDALVNSAVPVALFAAWRVFALGWKPEWFGRYLEGRKVE